MSQALHVGVAKVDITPQKPLQLTGFAVREGKLFTGVDSHLFARVFYFEQEAENGHVKKAMIVIGDILWWEYGLSDRLRRQIGELCSISPENVVLHATHSHSGPATMDGIDLGSPDEEYVAFLENEVCKGAEQALRSIDPVQIERGGGTFDLGVNRRKPSDGKIINAPYFEGIRDPELSVIRFVTSYGSTKALWMHYACHPVNSTERMVSSEYCGYAAEQFERQFGHDTVVGFLQGTCADINPYLPGQQRGLSAVLEAGTQLLQAATDVLDHHMIPIESGMLQVHGSTVELPFANLPTEANLLEIQRSGTVLEQKWATFMLQNQDRLKPTAKFELVAVHLADSLGLLFMNGEIVTRYGLFVKQLSEGRTLPVAYSNGIIGYVTTAEQLLEGGYEPHESVYYIGLPSPYSNEVEALILREIENIIV